MLVEHQSSIDLLLGLLVFLSWSHDHFLRKTGTLSRLMSLAMSLVCDLRLNKPLPPEAHMMTTFVNDGSYRDPSDEPDYWRHLELQRAVLACFLLSTLCVSLAHLPG